MKNKFYFFNKLVTFLAVLSLSGQSVAFAQAPQQQELPSNASQLEATWYVATTGNDAYDCATSATPCVTIKGALSKAASNDTIMIAEGTYTSSDIYYVVDIQKNIILSGGWDTNFTSQIGFSTIDGENSRTGINISTGTTIILENFIIQHAKNDAIRKGGIANDGFLTINNCTITENSNTYGGGIKNRGSLILNDSIVSHNSARIQGGGIYSTGYLQLNNSTVAYNSAYDTINAGATPSGGGIYNTGQAQINTSQIRDNQAFLGGGIFNSGTLSINNSSFYNNSAQSFGGGIINHTTVDIINTTISNNNAGSGGGIYAYGTTSINNSTITGNDALYRGGGIQRDQNASGILTIQNTILTNNTAIDAGADCYSQITSNGYNLVGTTAGCTITSKPGDKFNINPTLGIFLPGAGYHPLTPGGPAIDAGNPATCTPTDQRGSIRIDGDSNGSTICDIGAYEYRIPGPATKIMVIGGDDQNAPPGKVFALPLQVAALDSQGTPVSSVSVDFTAPANGPSGLFTNNDITINKVTGSNGVADSGTFTANEDLGKYKVTASSASIPQSVEFNLRNVIWFVALSGNNANACASPTAPCASLQGVLSRSEFQSGDIIRVAAGTYNFGDITLSKDVTISGGWNSDFTQQMGIATIEDGITIPLYISAIIENVTIQNTGTYGIQVLGSLYLKDSTIRLNKSGISVRFGQATISNTTISQNDSGSNTTEDGYGVRNYDGEVHLINSTVTGNKASYGGGVYHDLGSTGKFFIVNSIISGNISTYGTPYSKDCGGTFISLGHNLFGNIGPIQTPMCDMNFTGTDQFGYYVFDNVGVSTDHSLDAMLAPIQNVDNKGWLHPLLSGSPAINAGAPTPPGTPNSDACPLKDQRGVTRPQGSACDIGAYEKIYYPLSGNVGVPGVVLSYMDWTAKTAVSKADGSYSLQVPENWSGTVTPTHPCFTFGPANISFVNVTSIQTDQNFTPTMLPATGCVNVNIGGINRGTYSIPTQGSTRQNYAGVDSGPVKVVSTGGNPIISAIRSAWAVNGVTTSFSQLMGLPLEQLSDTYVFPGYNNVSLNDQLRIANVDTIPTTVTVTIGGTLRGTYPLAAGAAVRINYPGLDSGPVIVKGTSGVKIISSIREAWAVNGVTRSFVQLMGLPAGQLSNKYVFPAYNNVTLNEQLRIGNVDTVATSVTVTIGGTLRGTYPLGPGQAVRINYPGLDSGPVVVEGTAGVNIISSIRSAWAVNGVTTSFSQLMGMPAEQLSDKYLFPGYNNVTLNDQLRIANVDTLPTTVTVTIGGNLKGTYPLAAGAAVRINYPGLDSGPVVVQGTSGVKIISSIREAWAVNGVTQSFVQLMGLPAGQLSTTYFFPGYNNVTLNEQLRIGVP